MLYARARTVRRDERRLGQLDWTALVLLVAAGLGVGLLAGLFGVGGGILAVPALVLVIHLDQHAAEGTSLAMILPTTALAAYGYARRGSVRWGAALRVGVGAVVLSFLAAHLALALPSHLLSLIFAAFLLVMAWRTYRVGRASAGAGPARDRPRDGRDGWRQVVIGTGVGTSAGLLGVGGGTVATPALVLWCGFPAQVAQGTSLAAIVLSSLAGASEYALAGRIDWIAALALFVGAALTVPLGAAVAHRLPERRLRQVFAAFVAVVAVLEVVGSL